MSKTVMQKTIAQIERDLNITISDEDKRLWFELEKQQMKDLYSAGNDSTCMEHENINDYFEQYYNLKFKDNEK